MIIAGVDTGFSGAIALLDKDGSIHSVEDMPVFKTGKKQELDGNKIKELISLADHVFIEKAQVMPKQGVVSSSRFYGTGQRIIGICIGIGKPYTEVHPTRWKKAMMPDMQREKQASILRVKQLYPDISLPRKKDHGKADAILIARYGVLNA
jgi:crossover junction endodeoxyribonuclease RuvC